MKKTVTAILVLAALALGISSNFLFPKKEIVYATKPVVTDTTKLKAQLAAGMWNRIFFEIDKQANRMDTATVEANRKKYKDSLNQAVFMIIQSVNDTALNPILKK